MLAMHRMQSLVILPLIFFLVACGKKMNTPPATSWEQGKVKVVATTTMLADLCREVGGDRVHVIGLMGPEQDPHSYAPRGNDARLLAEADVVIANGLRLEGSLAEKISHMSRKNVTTLLVGDALPADKLLSPQEEFEGAKDPHIWGDVMLWHRATDLVATAIAKADPTSSATYQKNAADYQKELATLDAWIKEQVAAIAPEKRVLITGHDAFFYFGRAYVFEVRGIRGVSSAVESDLKQRAALVAFIKQRGIRTLFAESTVNGKEVEAVSRESGAALSQKVLFSDALGATSETNTYIGMMRHNVTTIVEGLK